MTETAAADVKQAGQRAALAVFGLWNAQVGTFWRSTEHRERTSMGRGSRQFFPTVTFRSIESLIELVSAHPDWAHDSIMKALATEMVPRLLTRRQPDLKSSIDLGDNLRLNPFTLSLYVALLERIVGCQFVEAKLVATAAAKLRSATIELIRTVRSVKRSNVAARHPFVLFHEMRAFRAAERMDLPRDLARRVRTALDEDRRLLRVATEVLLARDQLGTTAPSDAVAMAFCAAGLALCDAADHGHITAALGVACKAQHENGSWPLGRVVRQNRDVAESNVEMPSYEIAWALTGTLQSLAKRDPGLLLGPRGAETMGHLVRAHSYVQSSAIRMDGQGRPSIGWCSDHAYGMPLIESWTSATVLQGALSFDAVLEEHRRATVVKEMRGIYPTDPSWPQWLRWSEYRTAGEPDTRTGILTYIHRHFVEKVAAAPGGMPRAEDGTVSLLLFGPPGTSKTTIAQALADGLGWPLISLSPGSFIGKGLEFIEAEASRIFTVLLSLSRTVVFFDECDELFRHRKPDPASEQIRGISAFITASMLPKLQELHDRGQVVFVIGTNHLSSIDPAVKRGGRIDHIVGVGPPDETARRRIVSARAGASGTAKGQQVGVEELVKRTERFTRAELRRATEQLIARAPWHTAKEARKAATEVVDRFRDSLAITAEQFTQFVADRDQFSHPHLEES